MAEEGELLAVIARRISTLSLMIQDKYQTATLIGNLKFTRIPDYFITIMSKVYAKYGGGRVDYAKIYRTPEEAFN